MAHLDQAMRACTALAPSVTHSVLEASERRRAPQEETVRNARGAGHPPLAPGQQETCMEATTSLPWTCFSHAVDVLGGNHPHPPLWDACHTCTAVGLASVPADSPRLKTTAPVSSMGTFATASTCCRTYRRVLSTVAPGTRPATSVLDFTAQPAPPIAAAAPPTPTSRLSTTAV